MTKTNTEAVEAQVPRVWKAHDGEKCPVAPEGPVEIITRGGIQSFWPKAGAVVWEYGTFVPELGTSLPKSAEVVFYCRSAKTEPSAAGLVEADVSIAARAIRQTMRDYGHNSADTTLPEIIAGSVCKALSAPTREREMRETLSPVREALEQGAKWFEEYADHHAQLAKAAGFNVGKERDAKAERNRERASTLWEAVIAFDLAFKDQASE